MLDPPATSASPRSYTESYSSGGSKSRTFTSSAVAIRLRLRMVGELAPFTIVDRLPLETPAKSANRLWLHPLRLQA